MSRRGEPEKKVIKRVSYLPHELDSLLEELGDLSLKRRTEWLQEKRAINMKPDGMHVIQSADGSYLYLSLMDKWDALHDWEVSKQFAQRMKTERLDKLAQQFTIPNNVIYNNKEL